MLHLSTQVQTTQIRSFGTPAAPRPSETLQSGIPLSQPSRTFVRSNRPAQAGRSRSRNQRDNSFEGARNSAILSPGYGSQAVLFNGRIGRRDPVDVFKVTLLPNASISNLFASRQTIRQGPLNFRMIGDIRGNKIILIGANFGISDLPPESTPIQPPLLNQTGEPIDFYFRFAAVGRRESRYNLAFSFFQ
ncbi:MAG: hypothetical protein ACKO7W_15240 [Elainella sp.]